MSKTTWTIIFALIIILIAFLLYKAFKGKNGKCGENDTPYDCVQKLGAVPFKTASGQVGVSYGDYQFYPNNRARQNSTAKMGTFNKETITWDKNAGTTTIKSIFNK